jgi:hypothetical protein
MCKDESYAKCLFIAVSFVASSYSDSKNFLREKCLKIIILLKLMSLIEESSRFINILLHKNEVDYVCCFNFESKHNKRDVNIERNLNLYAESRHKYEICKNLKRSDQNLLFTRPAKPAMRQISTTTASTTSQLFETSG